MTLPRTVVWASSEDVAARSRPRKLLRSLSEPSLGCAGGVIMLTAVAAVVAPWVVPHDPLQQDVTNALRAPLALGKGGLHVLGTDNLGRDVLSRLIYGTRVSAFIAVTVVAVAGSVGVALGLLAGFFGGRFDRWLMRLCDIQLSFPFMLLAITAVGVSGAGLANMIVVLVVVSWVGYARISRAQALALRERAYVEAARALGVPTSRIILAHLLPNALAPVWVLATLEVGQMIIAEASLSFLGLGVPPPTPSWGSMLADGRDYIYNAWWLTVIPGLAILVLVLSVNLVGDWLVTRAVGSDAETARY